MTTPILKPSQAARDAAAAMWNSVFPHRRGETATLADGHGDDGPVVQAFARFEQSIVERVTAEQYALGLMTEEMAEALKIIGKALRFGLDAPGPNSAEYQGRTARQMLPNEIGDVHAGIRYAAMAGVFSMAAANDAESAKLAKLLDPASVDANGNRLAPAIRTSSDQ